MVEIYYPLNSIKSKMVKDTEVISFLKQLEKKNVAQATLIKHGGDNIKVVLDGEHYDDIEEWISNSI